KILLSPRFLALLTPTNHRKARPSPLRLPILPPTQKRRVQKQPNRCRWPRSAAKAPLSLSTSSLKRTTSFKPRHRAKRPSIEPLHPRQCRVILTARLPIPPPLPSRRSPTIPSCRMQEMTWRTSHERDHLFSASGRNQRCREARANRLLHRRQRHHARSHQNRF